MTALQVRCWGLMTSGLYIDHLLEDGREFGADVGLACWSERVPDGSGIVRQNTSHCAVREIHSVMACEVSVGGIWEEWGRRLVAARGIRRTIPP
jgi:hypothetical protein